jgi:hypothetical protein
VQTSGHLMQSSALFRSIICVQVAGIAALHRAWHPRHGYATCGITKHDDLEDQLWWEGSPEEGHIDTMFSRDHYAAAELAFVDAVTAAVRATARVRRDG